LIKAGMAARGHIGVVGGVSNRYRMTQGPEALGGNTMNECGQQVTPSYTGIARLRSFWPNSYQDGKPNRQSGVQLLALGMLVFKHRGSSRQSVNKNRNHSNPPVARSHRQAERKVV
jgi:hypothetical protein